MSWNFNDVGAWELGGLSINSTELTIAAWLKNVSGGGSEDLVLISDSADNFPKALLNIYHGGFRCTATWTHTTVDVITLNSNNVSGYQWHLCLISISATGPTATSRADGGVAATGTPLTGWPGAVMNRLRWGMGAAADAYYRDRSAHLAVWNKALSGTERDALWNGGAGGAGANPTAVAAANLLYYWYDSPTAHVGSGTLTAVGTTPTWDAADNPNVDAPSAGSPSILLTQVERGRTLCRGLGRGIA